MFSRDNLGTLISAIDSSGSYLWSFELYWYITVPLTICTIVVPLITGFIVRSLWKWAVYVRLNREVYFLVLLCLTAVGLMIYASLMLS